MGTDSLHSRTTRFRLLSASIEQANAGIWTPFATLPREGLSMSQAGELAMVLAINNFIHRAWTRELDKLQLVIAEPAELA